MATVAEMRDKLLSVDQLAERLAATEPLSQIPFRTELDPDGGGENETAQFTIEDGWNAHEPGGTDPVEATIRIGAEEYGLTKDALLEATSLIGLTKKYVEDTPGPLIVPQLNYWYQHKGKDLKALATDDRVLALTKGSIVPFSNVSLLERAMDTIRGKYGADAEVLVDYKLRHDLRRTHFRLVVPEELRAIREDDEWSAGVDVQNSLTGEVGTSLQGYLFRWWCTNGCTTNLAESPTWNRRTGGQGDDVYEWAAHAVDEILGHLDHEWEALEELANTPIDGDVNDVLVDVFETYRIPLAAREDIIEEMVNSDDLTMYGVQAAVTQAANREDISENQRQTLFDAGGRITHAFTQRCSTCHRLPIDR